MNGLVGKWFRTIKEGKVSWQGEIIEKVDDFFYIVQLYSLINNCFTHKILVNIEDMTTHNPHNKSSYWHFYDTKNEMVENCEKLTDILKGEKVSDQ
jgi:hypothetical protein